MKKIQVAGALLLGAVMFWGLLASAAEVRCEVWDLPEKGLVQLGVPSTLGEGRLEMTIDGESADFQEAIGGRFCIWRPSEAQRKRSKTTSLKVTMRRNGEKASFKRVGRVEISNTAFQLVFDEKKQAGLPSDFRWASGLSPKASSWIDRIHTNGREGKSLSSARDGEVWDSGVGPIFRQVRTVGSFMDGKGNLSQCKAKAIYDWLFFNESPEWVMLRMMVTGEGGEDWDQMFTGQLNFSGEAFKEAIAPTGKGGKFERFQLPTGKEGEKFRQSHSWAALVNGHDFAAVYSRGTRVYASPKVKLLYLLSSNKSAYSTHWNGEEKIRRDAFFRFGNAADVNEALKADTPVSQAVGYRFLVSHDDIDRKREGEEVSTVTAGEMTLSVGTFADRAELRSVKVGGRAIAIGPQPIFSAAVENVETGARTMFDSLSGWATVVTWEKGGNTYWRFSGQSKLPQLPKLTITVKAAPIAVESGIDWSFGGYTGDDGYALSQAMVGELSFLSQGRGMRAIWPGCMGEVKLNPCNDGVNHVGHYPSMGCVMQWQAVWNEETKRSFLVAAFDPKGGAKNILMNGRSADSSIKLGIRHLLSWERRAAGARSVMSGVIAWRPLKGDWYDAAVRYRDWSRENAVFYPKMGPEGRVTTPMWMKKLGFVARAHKEADGVVSAFKETQEILGVPVMMHWYVWHRQEFDNDYPNYFPARPGFEDGVKRIHELGGYAVPYTNGHLWDMHDAGCEDRYFTKLGAFGACRLRNGKVREERYRSKETNGTPVVFASMCPASRVWHDKVGDNCVKVVNEADCDGYYMDQVGAFSTCECFNPEHDHPFGGGSWWQEAYRKLLADERARAKKPIFLATEGNAEHGLDQIDAFVCWNIPGGIDTAPAFEVCYSGATTIYCRSPEDPVSSARPMRMKYANTLVDGQLFGWLGLNCCKAKESGGYLRKCVRFRQKNAEWFYLGEMRRVPELLDEVPVWDETWDIFGGKRQVKMPIVQTASRALLDYEYDEAGNRLWKTGKVKKAVVYFTNFSPDEKAVSRVKIDWADLGVNPDNATFTRVDEEGNRTAATRADLEGAITFEPDSCFGFEITERK